ncbi:DUF3077 domain-containing protein [Pseudomonas sp. SWRI154]|nr:DUF3077 domain-containing protein [Pseudomonas sp. SWRI154]
MAAFPIARYFPIVAANSATGRRKPEVIKAHQLRHASDLFHIAKLLAEDAAMICGADRYAWASCYLQEMSKAVIDDVVKVLEAPGNNPA